MRAPIGGATADLEGLVLTETDTNEQNTGESSAPSEEGSAPLAAGAPAEIGATAQPPRPRRRRRRRRGPRPAGAPEGTPIVEARAESAAPATEGAGVPVEIAATRTSGENTLRLRTRPQRRRRRRPPTASSAGETAAATPGGEPVAEGEASAPAPQTAPAEPRPPRLGPDGQPLRRRRRRRRPPQLGGAGENAAQAEAGGDPMAPRTAEPNRRPPRSRNRRDRGERPAGEPSDAASREMRPDRDRRSAGPRDGDRRREGPGGRRDGRGRRDSRDGRGRGDGPKKIERKLYTLDSIVDRGFEDVEEAAGTRRVHWTIVKRTVADQISRKPMSQSYVLQRDGVDSEFPNLGAARNAVNKTIVHPEKLTLSKAEHAAQKSGR